MRKSAYIFILILLLNGCSSTITEPTLENTEIQSSYKNKSEKSDKKIMEYINFEKCSYEVVEKTYQEENVLRNLSMKYPEITGLQDKSKMAQINLLIQASAFEMCGQYGDPSTVPEIPGHPAYSAINIHSDYEITLMNDTIISIVFKASSYVRGAAHPNQSLHTINIDIREGDIIFLEDLFCVPLYEYFDRETFRYRFESNVEGTIGHSVAEMSDEDLKQEFSKHSNFYHSADNISYSDFYFTKHKLALVINTVFTLGNYWEFEVQYDDIMELMK